MEATFYPGISVISTLGSIISHAYFVTGILPIRVAFPGLARCLLGPDITFSSLIDSLEANIIKRACVEARLEIANDLMPLILSVLSRFDVRQLPTHHIFQLTLGQVATYEFMTKSSAALSVLYSGISKQHQPFWKGIDINSLFSIYCADSFS
jgi:hypothetical protein